MRQARRNTAGLFLALLPWRAKGASFRTPERDLFLNSWITTICRCSITQRHLITAPTPVATLLKASALRSTACAEMFSKKSRDCPSGLTCEQIEQLLGMKHQTASARLRDLMEMHPSPLEFRPDPKTGKPQRRVSSSGRTARIYFAK